VFTKLSGYYFAIVICERSKTAQCTLAWISTLSFMPFFLQSKLKRQPGICNCFKKQKNVCW